MIPGNGSKQTLLALSATACMLLAANRADACSCMAFPEDVAAATELAYERADAVFVGNVTMREDGRDEAFDYRRVRFDVQKAWKGVRAGSSIALRTAVSSAACGFAFRKSASYLVFAYHDAENDIYTTSLCDLNRLERAATEHVRVLDSLVSGAAGPGTGSAKRGNCDGGRPDRNR